MTSIQTEPISCHRVQPQLSSQLPCLLPPCSVTCQLLDLASKPISLVGGFVSLHQENSTHLCDEEEETSRIGGKTITEKSPLLRANSKSKEGGEGKKDEGVRNTTYREDVRRSSIQSPGLNSPGRLVPLRMLVRLIDPSTFLLMDDAFGRYSSSRQAVIFRRVLLYVYSENIIF